MCIDTCIDMCIDMCIDVCLDMCIDMCIDTCTDMCLDVWLDLCLDMCRDMCIDMCIGVPVRDSAERARPEVERHAVDEREQWSTGEPTLQYISIADGMSIARIWACRYSKMIASERRSF